MRLLKRSIAVLLVLVIGLCPVYAAEKSDGADAVLPADMPSGWSHDAVAAALANGLLIGGTDGLLRPAGQMKGCELAAMIVRAFGAGEKADISAFTDVSPDAWYYDAMAYAVGAGWMKGDGDGHLMPEVPVTRVRYFTIMARALGLPEGDHGILSGFPDGAKVPRWARGSVSAMVEAGLVHGTNKGLEPSAPISREAVCQVFHNTFDTYISEPGIYEGLTGSVLVRCDGVTIKDSTLDRLCVGAGVTGSVALSNTEAGGILGNSDAAEIVPETPDPDPTPSTPDPAPFIPDPAPFIPDPTPSEPDPLVVLSDAFAHFSAHQENLTAQIVSTQDLGHMTLSTTELVRLDGDLELYLSLQDDAFVDYRFIDWSSNEAASALDDAYWCASDASAFYGVNSLYGLSLDLDASWFVPQDDGVYAVSAEHLWEAMEIVMGPHQNNLVDVALTVTVENGVLASVFTSRDYQSYYSTLHRTEEYTFLAFGENDLTFPKTYEQCDPWDIYADPEYYLDAGRFIADATVLYNNEGLVYAACSDVYGECSDAIPLTGNEALLSKLYEGEEYYCLATLRERAGDRFFPYELVVEKAWEGTSPYQFTPFTDYDSILELAFYLSVGPIPVNLLGVFATVTEGACVLTDADGEEAVIPAGVLSNEALAKLDGRWVNLNELFAIEGDNGEVLLTVTPTYHSSVQAQLNCSGLSVPLGTPLEQGIGNLAIVDRYTNQVLFTIEDEEMEVDVDYYDPYDPDTPGVYELYVYCEDEYFDSINIRVYETAEFSAAETADIPRLRDLDTEAYLRPELPSTSPKDGQTNILVIPVVFRDSTYESRHLDDLMNYLDVCFNGKQTTGWYSLREYYEAVSYGKFRLKADLLAPYLSEYSIEELAESKEDCPEQNIIQAALEYYDDQIDYSLYDNDGDGDIDCPYFVYLAPVVTGSDSFWAYNSWFDEGTAEYDGLALSQYLWMSLDFFDRDFNSPANEFDAEDTDGVYANCETLIHETGHALGLDDYYMTSGGGTDYIGASEMMDANIGSMTAYSRMLLGWVDPQMLCYVEADLTLGGLEASGDTVVIASDAEGALFGEYYTISLYTPTGPNEAKSAMELGLFSVPGIVIYHITNELLPGEPAHKVGQCSYFEKPNIALFRNELPHYSMFNRPAEDSDLFQAGDSVTLYWDDGTPAITLTVNSLSADAASISLRLPG